ncbi:MAG: hypothetical protein COB66_05605 [Coxiella sp. (in: Bacteria)]|nr:MAG: hypothetical protein COB66_05605 [Coxiella sp. (in: g-proteobacteria)]
MDFLKRFIVGGVVVSSLCVSMPILAADGSPAKFLLQLWAGKFQQVDPPHRFVCSTLKATNSAGTTTIVPYGRFQCWFPTHNKFSTAYELGTTKSIPMPPAPNFLLGDTFSLDVPYVPYTKIPGEMFTGNPEIQKLTVTNFGHLVRLVIEGKLVTVLPASKPMTVTLDGKPISIESCLPAKTYASEETLNCTNLLSTAPNAPKKCYLQAKKLFYNSADPRRVHGKISRNPCSPISD